MTVTLGVAVLVLIPIGVIYSSLFQDTGEVWPHLIENVLSAILLNTFWLVLGVGLGSFLIGVSLAWLITHYDFPGRHFFQWLLLLPLAVPTYVLGFVWIGLLDFSSPLNSFLRSYSISLPQVRSLGGLVFVMSFSLFPYVYLIAKNAFQSMGRSMMDASAVLGMNSLERFLKVGIPLARPWIVAGVSLVLMETLADFGTVAVFNYDTFTTAIYKTWFGLFSIAGAAQLSSLLVTFVLALILVETYARGRRGYAITSQGAVAVKPKKISGSKAGLASAICFGVFALGFLLPVIQLVVWTLESLNVEFEGAYWNLFWHTLTLGLVASGVICFVSILMGYSVRQMPAKLKWLSKIATLGYALPGTILAVGVYLSMIWLDKKIGVFFNSTFGLEVPRLLTGTVVAMLLAYFVRYLAVGYGPIESGMQRMTRSVEDAARMMGFRGWSLIRKIHVPIIRRGLITAFVLVLVDVMKEMPITLMTRPFGWDTFAVRIYEMTSEGEWERAALPALLLVITGFIPLFFLQKQGEKTFGS